MHVGLDFSEPSLRPRVSARKCSPAAPRRQLRSVCTRSTDSSLCRRPSSGGYRNHSSAGFVLGLATSERTLHGRRRSVGTGGTHHNAPLAGTETLEFRVAPTPFSWFGQFCG